MGQIKVDRAQVLKTVQWAEKLKLIWILSGVKKRHIATSTLLNMEANCSVFTIDENWRERVFIIFISVMCLLVWSDTYNESSSHWLICGISWPCKISGFFVNSWLVCVRDSPAQTSTIKDLFSDWMWSDMFRKIRQSSQLPILNGIFHF